MRFVQHDDYVEALRDPFNSPSEEFLPYNIGRSSSGTSQSFYIYSTFPVNSVYIEYVKYPQKVSYGGYPYLDGVVYAEQTLESAPHTHSEIVDIACQIAGLNTQNPEYIQLRNSKILIQE